MLSPRWICRLLTCSVFAVSLLFSYGPGALNMSLSASVAVSLAAAAAVWLSWARPVAALVVAVAMTALLPVVRSTFDVMALVLVLVGFQAAMRSDLAPWILVITVFGALTVNDIWLRVAFDRTFAEPTVLFPLMMTALAVGLGLQSRRVRRQHAELITLRDADRRRAVSDERRRIARDLHDVAAHHLSAVVVRNKLAQRLGTLDALESAAEFSARTSADALDSLRQVVHVLSADDESPLAPQPRLADIDAVVQRMEAAGLEVEVEGSSFDGRPARREVEVAVVRIAQEALANVLRHRGPGRAWFRLDPRDDVIEVTVEDDGPTAWPSQLGERAWHRSGSHGLTGMRERAESCGGQFVVGPSARGGWRVSAVLPLDAP